MAQTESGVVAMLPRSLALRGGLAVVLSAVVNALVAQIAGSLGVAPGFEHLGLARVAVFSAAGAVGATVVYAGLVRYVERPERTFTRVAVAVLVLSFLPDVGLLSSVPEATVPGVVTLMLMHVVVAVVAVGLLVAGRDEGGAHGVSEV